jgi:hypothetical protein
VEHKVLPELGRRPAEQRFKEIRYDDMASGSKCPARPHRGSRRSDTTRGAGRGIAAALGEAGATVICTGRSSRSGGLHSDYDRPETIEETAELVTSRGEMAFR